MEDLKKARELLASGGYTCVLCHGDYHAESRQRGVKPLLSLIDSGEAPKGFAAADKVVGRAAAYLYVLLGAAELYADVLSDTAAEVLDRYAVRYECAQRTATVFNRTLTGLCPMESSVLGIDEPEKALEAIRAKVRELAKNG